MNLHRINTAVPPAPTFARGFTLTEMAVVLAIVALLIGGMILPLSAQQDLRNNAATEKLLADVGEALYGFAASHAAGDGKPYLPCPDTDGDGGENRNAGGDCAAQDGDLPWADLGLGRQDAWGNPLRYAVTNIFSNSATGFALMSAGDLQVCPENTCATVLASAVPAVIHSRGKNGAAATAGADEADNADGVPKFVQREHDASFDDVVAWLPSGILTNRMIAAGKLP
jgi:prepilin-type N-terminal cleavage/methylation domain-containing protein